jgi:hypothetical protein
MFYYFNVNVISKPLSEAGRLIAIPKGFSQAVQGYCYADTGYVNANEAHISVKQHLSECKPCGEVK